MQQPNSRPSLLSALGAGLVAVLTLSYPAIVYWGLKEFGPRGVSYVLGAALIPVAIVRLAKARREAVKNLAFVPLLALLLIAAGAILNRAEWVKAVPVVINGAFLGTFLLTLRSSQPMIERFARLQVDELNEQQIRWCRNWTWIWCGYFLSNILIVSVLALGAPLSWWVFYTGLLSYLIMGLLFAVEYVFRKIRFKEFNDTIIDRLLRRAFSPKVQQP